MSRDITPLKEQLFRMLSSKGYQPKIVDTSNKEVQVPEEADLIRFIFTKDGKKYGPVDLTIEGNSIVIYLSDGVLSSPDFPSPGAGYDDSWNGLRNHIRSWGHRFGLGLSIKNQDHLQPDMAKRHHMKTNKIAEGYYPMGKQASYNDSVPNVKIVIQHTRKIEEGEQRFRNVEKIFIENTVGERILAPTLRPGVARIYARHIAEGGLPHDDRWKHLSSLVEEYTKMAGFVRATRAGQFTESAQKLVNEGINHYLSLRESLGKMTGHRGYNAYFEAWSPALMEEQIEEANLNELFVQETLDPRIENVLPILSKLHKKVNEMSEVTELAEWADRLIGEDESLTSNNPVAIPEQGVAEGDEAQSSQPVIPQDQIAKAWTQNKSKAQMFIKNVPVAIMPTSKLPPNSVDIVKQEAGKRDQTSYSPEKFAKGLAAMQAPKQGKGEVYIFDQSSMANYGPYSSQITPALSEYLQQLGIDSAIAKLYIKKVPTPFIPASVFGIEGKRIQTSWGDQAVDSGAFITQEANGHTYCCNPDSEGLPIGYIPAQQGVAETRVGRINAKNQGNWELQVQKLWPKAQIEYAGEDHYTARLSNGYLVAAFMVDQGGWVEPPKRNEQGVAEAKADPLGAWIAHKNGTEARKFKTREGAKKYVASHEGFTVSSSEAFHDTYRKKDAIKGQQGVTEGVGSAINVSKALQAMKQLANTTNRHISTQTYNGLRDWDDGNLAEIVVNAIKACTTLSNYYKNNNQLDYAQLINKLQSELIAFKNGDAFVTIKQLSQGTLSKINFQQGVAEGDYPDGSSIKTPGNEDWKQQYQQAVMAVKNARTQQEYEAASDRAGRIKDLLASKGIQVGAVLGQQGVAEGKSDYKIKSIGTDAKGDYYISPSTGKKVYKSGVKKGDHENPKTGEHKGVNEERTETKDKEGNVIGWQDGTDWKKSKGKDPRGKVTNLSDKARRETEKAEKEKVKEGNDDLARILTIMNHRR